MLVARDLAIKPPGADLDPVVRGFSLELAAGEWVAVTGPNGSGKSCVALALAGLMPVTSGTVHLGGVGVKPETRDVLEGAISVVLQEPATQLLQNSVADELVFAAHNLDRPADQTAERCSRWSARLGLTEVLGVDPRTLSAGWQQTVLMAAAMIAAPRLLIVDEAGAHLDDELRRRVLDAVRHEADAGLSVVWVSQEPQELAAADRVVDLGGTAPVTATSPRPAPATLEQAGGRLLTLRVAPWSGAPGPFVRTDLELEIEVGRRGTVALTGRNGCGKTVALGVAAGLITSAQIRPFWHEAWHQPPILASQYPEQQIFSEIIEEELTYAAVRRGLTRDEALERALAALKCLDLCESFLSRRTWNLSTGEKRMVELIATLIAPASIVLLDEPTCGLDQARKFALVKLVRERSECDPVLVASQDSSWIEQVAGRVFDLAPAWQPKDAKYQRKNGLTQTCPSA